MKVLLFTLEYPPFKGGIAKYYSDIAKNWLSPDNIFVLHNNDNQLLFNKFWPRWLKAVKALHKEVKNKQINHVLVGQILPLGTAAWLAQKLLKFEYSVFIHGLDINFAQRTWPKRLLTKIILKNAAYIICNSGYSAEAVKKLILGVKEKIQIVHPGVDYPNYQLPITNYGLITKYDLKNRFIIFSIGRLVKRKGFDMMIKAIPRISAKYSNVVYVVAGTGPSMEYLKKLAIGHENSIKFIGQISEAEKWAWLRACDIFATPSRVIRLAATNGDHTNKKLGDGDAEGFGIVFLEANLAGKPVIAGRGGGVEDAVIDYETGILVDGKSTDDIVDGVIELIKSPQLRIKLGEQGMKRVLEECGVKKQVKKLYNIITKK